MFALKFLEFDTISAGRRSHILFFYDKLKDFIIHNKMGTLVLTCNILELKFLESIFFILTVPTIIDDGQVTAQS